MAALVLSMGIIFNRFYENVSLSNIVANLLFFSIISTHFAIVIESIAQSQAQIKLIEKFSLIDNLLSTKFGLRNTFPNEKHAIFSQILVLFSISLIIKILTIGFQFYTNHLNTIWYWYSDTIIWLRSIQILNFIYLLKCGLHLIHTILVEVQEHLTEIDFIQKKTGSKFEHSFAISTYDQLLYLKIIFGEFHDICE